MDAHELVAAPLLALVRSSASLRARCAAAHHDDGADVELVHDLRVSMRRLRSVLRPVRALYGGRVCDDAEETLRGWLILTSDLRDEEVLRETLAKLIPEGRKAGLSPVAARALAAWQVGRARRERGARARTLTAVSRGDARALVALEARLVTGPRRAIDAGEFSSELIDRALAKLEERAGRADPADGDAMHRTRIAAKKLRYAAALLGGKTEDAAAARADDAEPRLAALGAIERGAARIQKRLGDLHDLDEAMVRVRRAWGLDHAVRGEIERTLANRRADVGVKAARELGPDVAALRALHASVNEWTPRVAHPPIAPNPEEEATAAPEGDAPP
ncbi:MAG: CHAD domain-containing protein [Polyangiaceae bacterium]